MNEDSSVKPLFNGAAFTAFLFDMDGTLLTSIDASTRVWTRWAQKFELDACDFLPTSHGMRVTEVIEQLAIPGIDVEAEAELIFQAELTDMTGIVEIPGAAAFLLSLPPHRWGVVTSAPRELALRRIAVAGLPPPPILISAEDISRGKPDPACYLLAAERLQVTAPSCLVFEDAAAGIAAGQAAGCNVVVITDAHQSPVVSGNIAVPNFKNLFVIQPGDKGEMCLHYNERGRSPL